MGQHDSGPSIYQFHIPIWTRFCRLGSLYLGREESLFIPIQTSNLIFLPGTCYSLFLLDSETGSTVPNPLRLREVPHTLWTSLTPSVKEKARAGGGFQALCTETPNNLEPNTDISDMWITPGRTSGGGSESGFVTSRHCYDHTHTHTDTDTKPFELCTVAWEEQTSNVQCQWEDSFLLPTSTCWI